MERDKILIILKRLVGGLMGRVVAVGTMVVAAGTIIAAIITVVIKPPVAVIKTRGELEGNAPLIVNFDGGSSDNSVGIGRMDYQWTVARKGISSDNQWTKEEVFSDDIFVDKKFDEPGYYRVALKVTNIIRLEDRAVLDSLIEVGSAEQSKESNQIVSDEKPIQIVSNQELSFTKSTTFQAVDIYILEDVSGSMKGEITSIKSNFKEMIVNITCQAGENPAVDYCIPNVEIGAGRFGVHEETWKHLKDIDADYQATQGILPAEAGGGDEQPIRALQGMMSGTCASDASRVGTACFRPDSLRLVVFISDEDFTEDDTYNTAAQQATYDTMASLGIRVIGVIGDNSTYEVPKLITHLMGMQSGSTQLVPNIFSVPDSLQCAAFNSNPFYESRAIISGPDQKAGDAVTCAIQAVTASLLLGGD